MRGRLVGNGASLRSALPANYRPLPLSPQARLGLALTQSTSPIRYGLPMTTRNIDDSLESNFYFQSLNQLATVPGDDYSGAQLLVDSIRSYTSEREHNPTLLRFVRLESDGVLTAVEELSASVAGPQVGPEPVLAYLDSISKRCSLLVMLALLTDPRDYPASHGVWADAVVKVCTPIPSVRGHVAMRLQRLCASLSFVLRLRS